MDRDTPPAAQTRAEFVSATVDVGGQRLPIVLPDAQLPWRFHIQRALATRLGEATVVDAVRQWDGIPGSRWATSYAGLTDAGGGSDGLSVVFAKPDCPPGVGGYAYWQLPRSESVQRYGEGGVYLTDVDVAICNGVATTDVLRQVVAHEVGHAFGLQHLCDPQHSCWLPGMGPGSHACRVMYGESSACPHRVDQSEYDGVRHLYGTLRRLSGPSRVETAARASFASFARQTAPAVVLARGDRTAHGPIAAAGLSGTLRGPLLLGTPDPTGCVTGTTATELARAAASGARVMLIGEWPASCATTLASWDLRASMIDHHDVVTLGLAVADEAVAAGASAGRVFLVSAQPDRAGHVPDGVAAAAAAGSSGGVVVFTQPDRLTPAVSEWLRRQAGGGRVYLMGGHAALAPQVAADVQAAGFEAVRVAGSGRVETALALAGRTELFTGSGVILAAAASWADAVTGSSLGGRAGNPVLLTPPSGHPGVEAWLAAKQPQPGFVVGGPAVVPYELQWRYTAHVRR